MNNEVKRADFDAEVQRDIDAMDADLRIRGRIARREAFNSTLDIITRIATCVTALAVAAVMWAIAYAFLSELF